MNHQSNTLSYKGLLTINDRWKNVAIRDRHSPRSTWYHPSAFKKSGGGKANWGREQDFYDETEIPINEPFNDPAYTPNFVDNTKLRVPFNMITLGCINMIIL